MSFCCFILTGSFELSHIVIARIVGIVLCSDFISPVQLFTEHQVADEEHYLKWLMNQILSCIFKLIFSKYVSTVHIKVSHLYAKGVQPKYVLN